MKTFTIFGYGSLMTYSSVLKTMPSAKNHRRAVTLPPLREADGREAWGFERAFTLVSISGIKSGSANFETMEVSALALRKAPSTRPGSEVQGVVFEIPESEWEPYKEREHRYKFLEIDVKDEYGNRLSSWTVFERTDEEYRATMPEKEYQERVLQYFQGRLWGDPSVKPLRQYLINCIQAAIDIEGEGEGKDTSSLANLWDHAYLADGTSIRNYVLSEPARFPDGMVQLAKTTPQYGGAQANDVECDTRFSKSSL
jgi:cation transport regulator ChaC